MTSPSDSPESANSSTPSAKPYRHAAKLPISSVTVVGCGGNGSIFVSHLCRIWQAWTKLGGDPFKITLFDDDTVDAGDREHH